MTADCTADHRRERLCDALEAALRDALRRRGVGSINSAAYYLQWTARIDGTIFAEAVSNGYLDWAYRLRPAQQRALLAMDWQVREDVPNYQVCYDDLDDLRPLARLLADTWCDVYGLDPDDRDFSPAA
jgi:hypothetical protein